MNLSMIVLLRRNFTLLRDLKKGDHSVIHPYCKALPEIRHAIDFIEITFDMRPFSSALLKQSCDTR